MGDPRLRRVWFDVAQAVSARTGSARAAVVVRRIRQLGVERVPRDGWTAFLALSLTDAEFQDIAANVPPYMR